MLREIYCEQFHQKRIEFDDGLNVVLGTSTGDNSIGKSTLMLIIDFVFGGKTYSEETDILEKVGPHRICLNLSLIKNTIILLSTTIKVMKCGYAMKNMSKSIS